MCIHKKMLVFRWCKSKCWKWQDVKCLTPRLTDLNKPHGSGWRDTRHQNLHNTMFLWTWAKQLPKLDAFDYLRAQKQFEAHFSGCYMKSNTATKCAHDIHHLHSCRRRWWKWSFGLQWVLTRERKCANHWCNSNLSKKDCKIEEN